MKRWMARRWWFLLATCILLGAAGAVVMWSTVSQPDAAAAQTYTTEPVRRGDLTISVSGSGVLAAGTTLDLAFPVSGTVSAINVRVGDKVTAGKLLAALDNADELKVAVQTRELELAGAQKALQNLLSGSGEALAQAQLDLGEARAALADAQKGLRQKGVGRCDKNTTETYYYAYIDAQRRVNEWESYLSGGSGYGEMYILQMLRPMRKERDLAYINWKYCEGYTGEEIDTSAAGVQLAKARVDQAEAAYEKLKASSGLDQDQVALLEAKVADARAQLAVAQANLAGIELEAPIDGTVISVSGNVGEPSGTETFITLADLDHPQVTFSIDETDLQGLKQACPATVTFDALPDKTFSGKVSEVAPELSSSGEAAVVDGSLTLDAVSLPAGRTLMLGQHASVEIICEQAKRVLLAPVDALHTNADGTTFLYVLNAAGVPEKRDVEAGIRDSAFVEIRSGVSMGEHVVVGNVQAQ